MQKTTLPACLLIVLSPALAMADDAALQAGTGRDPELPAPQQSLLPTVKIAPARGWSGDDMPVAAAGLKVNAFASGLDHPRWLAILPNGDVLVAESNAQPKSPTGPKDFVMKQVMKVAGAGVESPDMILVLRDADGDGVAEIRSVLLDHLTSPFGMAVVGEYLYVADTDALLRFPYRTGQTRIEAPGEIVTPLPAGEINHHWTKGLLASPDGRTLYVSVGSNSDHGENGIEAETDRAAIWKVSLGKGKPEVFASGLRNPVGLAFEPHSGILWTSVNERDEIGDNLVPDYMTSVHQGEFFGWPYSYYGTHVDPRVKPDRPDLVAEAKVPDYALGAHTASLGLAFAKGSDLGAHFSNGAFVGQHGSWNRNPPSGYRVIFVPFQKGEPVGQPVEVLTGFLDDEGNAKGRPAGVTIDRRGALLVADDVGNTIWRVSKAN